tara:strand:- start:176 stop:4222 length:4047 start_codon:yes stop_codon:yes gene_type:complete
MSKTIRIRTTPNGDDNFIKINMEQDFDFVEILSLKISQKELYTTFCAGYGAIVGRVSVNGGFGVPNAKVSVFIPVSDLDKENDKIFGLYPFETITDKGPNGLRYNLLSNDNQTIDDCFTPVGDFPDKRTFLDDDTMLDIYCEYYKFTTTSNAAGDYMIFGAPVGAQIMHVEADVSDIGIISQNPFDFIRKGGSEENFESTTKFYGSEDDLDFNLQIIKQSPISVNVQPYWGDEDNCNVAITRRDIDLKSAVNPQAIFMGSIFGDNDGNAISIKCRPSRNMGTLTDQTTGAGRIEMVRETIGGGIERFDIGGGQLIDSDGTWAYQIPMNLDYRVTDEYGNLVPTDDPKKGIPTRAKVRFRLKMDITGGEGNLRERASYLIPNNPLSNGNVKGRDAYEFGPNTRNEDLAELTWNTIYSVKNFIGRFQKTEKPSEPKERSFIGIKDVDSARSGYTPFPYNHLNFQTSALFSFLCMLSIVLALLVVLINGSIVMLINGIINTINSFLNFFGIDSIAFVPCVTLDCDDVKFAPGCCSPGESGVPCNGMNSFGCQRVNQLNGNNVWCIDDSIYANGWADTLPPGDAGYTNCIALSLAQSLDLFQFDFYNDWVNGSLYSPLFKARVKDQSGPRRFCEWSGGSAAEDLSVDNDNDGNFDNLSYDDQYMVESCFGVYSGCTSHDPDCGPFTSPGGSKNKRGHKSVGSRPVGGGLIIYYDNHYYYSSAVRDQDLLTLATDIISLGSSVRCHWLGLPPIHELLVDTTYKLPPYLPYAKNQVVITSGMDAVSVHVSESLFFEINCFYTLTDNRTCGNLRRQCELGVGLDELRNGVSPPIAQPTIGVDEIDVNVSRNIFAWLNNQQLQTTHPSAFTPIPVEADFDNNPNCGVQNGTPDYNTFRYNTYVGNAGTICNSFPRPYDSFYFYFGLNRRKTALSKLNSKYFAPCPVKDNPDFLILGDTFNSTTECSGGGGGDGAINVTIQGGTAPFTYTWVSQSVNVVSVGNADYQIDFAGGAGDLEDLCGGAYTLTVLDANGLSSTITFIVSEPQPVSCITSAIPTSQFGAADGIINVTINYGAAPYSVVVTGPVPSNLSNLQAGTAQITGLLEGTYYIDVTDVNGVLTQCSVVVTEPLLLSALINRDYDIGNDPINNPNDPFDPLSYPNYNYNSSECFVTPPCTETSVLCNGDSNATVRVIPFGGTPPYTVSIIRTNPIGVAMDGLPNGSPTAFVVNNLGVGLYNVSVEDNVGSTWTSTLQVTDPPSFTIAAFDILANTNGTTTTSDSVIIEFGGVLPSGEDITVYFYNSSGDPLPLLTETIELLAGITTYEIVGLASETAYSINARNLSGCISNEIEFMTQEP